MFVALKYFFRTPPFATRFARRRRCRISESVSNFVTYTYIFATRFARRRLGVNSRFLHLSMAVFLVILGFLISALFDSATVKIAGLAVTGAGLWGNYGPLWSMVTQEATGSEDKGTFIAFCNGFGTIAGMIGPYLVTVFDTREWAFVFFAVVAAFSLGAFLKAVDASKSGLVRW